MIAQRTKRIAPRSVGDPLAAPPAPRVERPRGLLITAAWLGLVVGALEVGLLLTQRSLNHLALIGSLRLNQHYTWMIPVAHLAVFGLIGLGLEMLARLRPGLARVVAPRLLAGLAALALLLAFRELHPLAALALALGTAARIVPLGRRLAWAAGFGRVTRVSLPFLLVGLLALIVGRHEQLARAERAARVRPTPQAGAPNVLLLVMDTVRARSLSLYGYPRATSPRLAELAARGVRFDQARSTAPWTLPSHASMFTGRWPHEIFEHSEQPVPASLPTLAGVLGQQGYATGGFVANTYYCNAGYGLGQGFDHYEDFYQVFDTSPTEVLRHSGLGRNLIKLAGDEESIRPSGRKSADKVNEDFLGWLDTTNGRPFFAFLNYFDAHAPYFLPSTAPSARRFGIMPMNQADVDTLGGWQNRPTTSTDPHELELARDAYDDCVGYLDSAIGRLGDELDRRGVLDNTLLIITADHGEEIGEHGLSGHGRSLYRDELHVPLIVVRPRRAGSAGAVVAEPVSLRDLPSTVLDLIGLGVQPSPFPGQSLGRFAELGRPVPPPRVDQPTDPTPVVLSEVALRSKVSQNNDRPPALRGPMVSVVAEGHVYIRNSDGREELYHLATDPSEAHDLAHDPTRRDLLARLQALTSQAHPNGGP